MKRITIIVLFLFLGMQFAFSQGKTITGTVTSAADGSTIPGVQVVVKGTTIGTTTDIDGKYSFTLPASAQILRFTFIGMETQEIEIGTQTEINIQMNMSSTALDEVVVVGYGIQTKRNISGSISSVKGEEIKSIPIQSFEQALQGKATGVNITMPNGVLGNPAVIRVRGFNSISSSSFPLVVVDGVAVLSGELSMNSSANNPLSDINPSDIASMEILKDASATAIYGSRAANGVIIITTKRGSESGLKNKVTVNLDSYMGWSSPYNTYDMMNAEQYVAHKNLARTNAGLSSMFFLSYDANGNLIDTDWADLLYRTGAQNTTNLSVSGSTDKTNYFVSLGYSDQEGMIVNNQFTRKSARANIDHKLNQWVTINSGLAYTNSYNSAPNTGSLAGQAFNTSGLARLAFVSAPIVGPRNLDGTYNNEGWRLGRLGNPDWVGYGNPICTVENDKFYNESDRLLANIGLLVNPIKDLFLKTTYGVDYSTVESVSFYSPLTTDGSPDGYVYNYMDRRKSWTWTTTANYVKTINEKFNFNLLAGVEEQYYHRTRWGASKYLVSDPFFTTFQGNWTEVDDAGGNALTENYFLSYFGRFNFNYNQKYYFDASVRRDAFSGLAAGNKWGTFGGASVMWNLSAEDFIMSSFIGENLSDLRLKASYGRVGNISGVADFGSLFLYGAGQYAADATLFFNQAGNADLKWELSDKLDIGLSFGILKDRIQVEMSYFYNNINQLIMNTPQAPSKGIPGNTIPENVGSMYNKGFEFAITTYNINKKNFSWTSTLNISTLKNEVTSLAPGIDYLATSTSGLEQTNRTVVGYPIGMIWGVKTNGVDPTTGRRVFVDGNGREVLYSHVVASGQSRWTYRDDGTAAPAINVAADGQILGSGIPTLYGGFDNNFKINKFDVNIGFTFALGFEIYNGSKAGLRDQRYWNNSVEVYTDAWKQPGDITDIPRPVYNDNVSNGSTMVMSNNVEKGNFVKVRNIAIGYTIDKIPTTWGIQKVRIYSQIFNAFTFTSYTGADPEISANGNSNLAPGIDRNTAPQARTITFGVNVTF